MRWNDDNPFAVADDHVAWKHGHAAATDGYVDIDGMMDGEIERRAAARAEHRKIHRRNCDAVAQSSIGHDSGRAAHLEAADQDASSGSSALIATAVHDQHLAGRYGLNRLALGMLRILEHAHDIQIFSRRNVTQREGLADHRRTGPTHAPHALYEDIAKTALEQLRRQCRERPRRGDSERRSKMRVFAG